MTRNGKEDLVSRFARLSFGGTSASLACVLDEDTDTLSQTSFLGPLLHEQQDELGTLARENENFICTAHRLCSLLQVYSLPDGSFDLSHIDCSLPLDCDDDELLLEEDDLRARVEARVLNPRPTSMTAILVSMRNLYKHFSADSFHLSAQVQDRSSHEEERKFASQLHSLYEADDLSTLPHSPSKLSTSPFPTRPHCNYTNNLSPSKDLYRRSIAS